MKINNQARAMFITTKTVKKQKKFKITVLEYLGSAPGDKKEFFYPEFKALHDSKAAATKFAIKKANERMKRFPNIKFITRFL